MSVMEKIYSRHVCDIDPTTMQTVIQNEYNIAPEYFGVAPIDAATTKRPTVLRDTMHDDGDNGNRKGKNSSDGDATLHEDKQLAEQQNTQRRLSVWREASIVGETHNTFPVKSDESLDAYVLRVVTNAIRNNSSALSFDGVNCCGKTTALGNHHAKVSSYSLMQQRNVLPPSAFEYLLKSVAVAKYSGFSLMDRSPISNLAFQYVYYLKDRLEKNAQINGLLPLTAATSYKYHLDLERQASGAESQFSAHHMCCDYTDIHNLRAVLEYVNNLNLNVLIVVDSDAAAVAKRILQRGVSKQLVNDVAKSSALTYHRSQTIAFSYLGLQLGYPVLDLEYLRIMYPNESDVSIFQTIGTTIQNVANTLTLTPNHSKIPIEDMLVDGIEDDYLIALAISTR